MGDKEIKRDYIQRRRSRIIRDLPLQKHCLGTKGEYNMNKDILDEKYKEYILSFFNCDFEEFLESEIKEKEEFMISRFMHESC